jgi:hypothetical protein
MVVCTCHPSNKEKLKIGQWWSRLAWAKKKNDTLSPKYPEQKGLEV